MALLNIEGDPWLLEHDSCEKLHRDIMEQLSLRQRELKTSDGYAKLSATIRIRIKQYNNEVGQLKQKLDQASRTGIITFEETERRNRQVEVLQSKSVHMQKLFDEQTLKYGQERVQLMGPSNWSSNPDVIEVDHSHETVGEIRNEQRRMLGEQDEGLENLSKIILRQKSIAQTISGEVDLQNDILDDLGDHIERTDTRVRGETVNVIKVDNKDRTCAYWVVIIVLLIAIITVTCV